LDNLIQFFDFIYQAIVWLLTKIHQQNYSGGLSMGERNFRVNDSIEIGYQAPNAESGLIGVVSEIFLPTKLKDLVNFPDVTLVEVADTGTYRGQFTPNVAGVWQIISHKADGTGKVTKSFSVGSHNVHTVGELVLAVNTAVGVVSDKVDDTTTAITTVDEKADTINTKIDALSVAVGNHVTPPMAF
jgi:hypothetical protein